jgi:predicted nucleotidyltransferase
MATITRDDELIKRLEALLAEQHSLLTTRGVRELSLVGSRARGTATPTSDVDLLMDLAPDAAFGLLDLVAFKDALRDALGVEVDVVFRSRLRPYVAERMTRDTVRLL